MIWTDPPDREEAGSPNVVGAVALHAAFDAFAELGWPAIIAHDRQIAAKLQSGSRVDRRSSRCSAQRSKRRPCRSQPFTVDGVPHALVAARLAAEDAIGVRHGCFCAHPYLIRLLGSVRRRGRGIPRRDAQGRPDPDARCGEGERRDRHLR